MTTARIRRDSSTVLGDAGVGKTRLLEELSRVASHRAARVLRGRCLSYGRGITFWPVLEMVKEAAGILEDGLAGARGRARCVGWSAATTQIADAGAAAVGLSSAQF